MTDTTDLLIVGGGIVGHGPRGRRPSGGVDRPHPGTLPRAHGRVGPQLRHGLARRPARGRRPRPGHADSREVWLELNGEAGLRAEECGSLHLARHADELRVLDGYVEAEGAAFGCSIIEAEDDRPPVPRRSATTGCSGRCGRPAELRVDSPFAVRRLADWLETQPGISIERRTTAVGVEGTAVRTACGRRFEAERVLVCSGSDFETLYPESFAASPVTRCKLQMMATEPQPAGWRLGPHIAGGLTLLHYAAFQPIEGIADVSARLRAENPDFHRWGIHVMASQYLTGEVVIGDSHVYGDDALEPFDDAGYQPRRSASTCCRLIELPESRDTAGAGTACTPSGPTARACSEPEPRARGGDRRRRGGGGDDAVVRRRGGDPRDRWSPAAARRRPPQRKPKEDRHRTMTTAPASPADRSLAVFPAGVQR